MKTKKLSLLILSILVTIIIYIKSQQALEQGKQKNNLHQIQTYFQTEDEANLFAMRQQINLPFNGTVPSVVLLDGKQIYLVTKNKAIIYKCIQFLTECDNTPIYLQPDAQYQLTDITVSPADKKYLITTQTSGNMNVFVQSTPRNYIKKLQLKNTNKSIWATRMLNGGKVLLTGGDDMQLRAYQFTDNPSVIYSLKDTKNLSNVIVDIAVNQVNRIKNFIFVANGMNVAVFSCPLSGTPILTFEAYLDWKYGQITTIDSLARAASIQESILVIGGKGDKVAIYKYNQSNKKHEQIDLINEISYISEVALSPGGKYLSIGKYDSQNNIYQQALNQKGQIKFKRIQTFKMGGSANYARSVKFALQGQSLAQARDQSIIRTYTLGGCQPGHYLDNGICFQNSYAWIIIVSITGLLILTIIIIIIARKIRRIPGQVKQPAIFYNDQEDYKKIEQKDNNKKNQKKKTKYDNEISDQVKWT